MSLKIYQYPKCNTCRNALKFLDKQKVKYQSIDISEKPPTKKEIKQMLDSLAGDIKKLFNTSGKIYRERSLKDKVASMNEKEAIDLLASEGKLIKRPFILSQNGNMVGFKEAELKKLLKS